MKVSFKKFVSMALAVVTTFALSATAFAADYYSEPVFPTSTPSVSVTTSEKSLIGSALNGEGFLNTFRAKSNGVVWLAPTSPIYNKLKNGLGLNNKGSNNLEVWIC